MPEGEGDHAVNPNDPHASSTRATRGTWPQPTVKEGDQHAHAPPPEPAAPPSTTKRKNRMTIFGKKNKSSPTRPPSEESGLTRKTKPAMAPRHNSAANRNGLFRDPREEALALGMDPIPPPTTASSTPGGSGNKHKKSSRKSRSISQSDSDHPNNNNHHHHGHGTGGNNSNSDRRSSISDARQNSAINTESLARDPRLEMEATQRRAQVVMAQQKNDNNSNTANDESSRPGRNGLGRVNEENDYLEESNNGHGNGNGGCAVGTTTTNTKERERPKPSHSLLANYMIEDVSTLHLEDTNSESPTTNMDDTKARPFKEMMTR